MQQYVRRSELPALVARPAVAHRAPRLAGRLERTVAETLLWIGSASAFIVLVVALAALLLHMGLEPKLAELFLGLSYFPLYLIVRRAWMTARYKLFANDLDAFIEAPDIKA